MAVSDIVSITISTQTVTTQADGFGVPLILSPNADFAERVRFYTGLAGLVTDGYAVTDPEYLAASALLSQEPRVKRFAMGKCALPQTQRWAITPVAGNTTVYKMYVNGNTISFTSDASGTVTEIIAGLKIAIDLLGLAITVSDQTTFMRIVANTPGAHFAISVDDTARLGIAQDHADPGVATDLAAILTYDSTWYGLLVPGYVSKAVGDAVASWAETNKKLFVAASQDSAIITLATGSDAGGAETFAKKLRADARRHSACIYHPENGDFADAAWMGRMLSTDPGKATWIYKTLSGVTSTALTTTHETNLDAKYCSYYTTSLGESMTLGAKVGSGEWIDVVRDTDWFESRLMTRIISVLGNADKIPYTDEGVATVVAEVREQFNEAIKAGFVAKSPKPVVSAPLVADVSAANKAARLLPDVTGQGTLAGAIHQTDITVTISL